MDTFQEAGPRSTLAGGGTSEGPGTRGLCDSLLLEPRWAHRDTAATFPCTFTVSYRKLRSALWGRCVRGGAHLGGRPSPVTWVLIEQRPPRSPEGSGLRGRRAGCWKHLTENKTYVEWRGLHIPVPGHPTWPARCSRIFLEPASILRLPLSASPLLPLNLHTPLCCAVLCGSVPQRCPRGAWGAHTPRVPLGPGVSVSTSGRFT